MTIQDALNQDWNARLDNKINTEIDKLVNSERKIYQLSDLDKKVNSDETLREYLEDSFTEMQKLFKRLDRLNEKELNTLIAVSDLFWTL